MIKSTAAAFALSLALATSSGALAGVAPEGSVTSPAVVPVEANVEVAHGLHYYCQAGPRRGWVHRHGIWSLGVPTSIGCY